MHHLASTKPFVRSFKLKLKRQHVKANCLLHLHVFSLSHCLPAIHLARHKWNVTKAKLRHIQLTRDSVSSQGMLTYGAIRVLQALTTIFLLQHSAQLKKIFKAFELTLPEAQRLAQRGKTGELALAVIFGVKGSHFDPVSAVRFDGKWNAARRRKAYFEMSQASCGTEWWYSMFPTSFLVIKKCCTATTTRSKHEATTCWNLLLPGASILHG